MIALKILIELKLWVVLLVSSGFGKTRTTIYFMGLLTRFPYLI